MDKPGLYASLLETAETKFSWFKKQLKSIEKQKILQKSDIINDKIRIKSLSYHEFPQEKNLNTINPTNKVINVRASVASLSLDKKRFSQENNVLAINSPIRGKSSKEGQLSLDYNQNSQGEKIRKLIINNRVFEGIVMRKTPILDVFNSFFNCKKERVKSRSFYQKIEKKTEEAAPENIKKTTDRLFSATFYLRNNETKEKFLKNTPIKTLKTLENVKNEEKNEKVKVFKLEGQSSKWNLKDFLGKREKFQMNVRNLKGKEFSLRKTKHRQFFVMHKEKKRAISARM